MTQLDDESIRFIHAVHHEGGTANITRIRKLAGLDRHVVNYRFKKLRREGYIDQTKEPSPGDLPDRKVAHLTGMARREIERGFGGSSNAALVTEGRDGETDDDRVRLVALEEQMTAMREAQKAAHTEQRDVATLRERVDDLEEYVYEWTEAAEEYLRAVRNVLERFLPVDDIFSHGEKE